MKKISLSISLLLTIVFVYPQTIVFQENFESTLQVVSSGTPGWNTVTGFYNSGNTCDSSRVAQGATSYLTTNTFSTNGYSNVLLEFAHICKIEFLDSARIEISTDNGLSWIKLTTNEYLGTGQFNGNKFYGNSYLDWVITDTSLIKNTWWKLERFNISSLVANIPQMKIRFVLHDGTNNGHQGYAGWLIDDIKVIAANSELIPPTIVLNNPILKDTLHHLGPFYVNATITDASGIDSAYIVYTLNGNSPITADMNNTTGNIFIGKIDTLPVKFNLGDTICYYVAAVDASSASNLNTEPLLNCNSFVMTNIPSDCDTIVTSLPLYETFDNFPLGTTSCNSICSTINGWANKTNDDKDWCPHGGSTWTPGTGPDGDHTSRNGKYLYLEADACYNKTAILTTPCINITNVSTPYLEFWYHMYGTHIGELHVDIYYQSAWINDIFTILGDQGNTWHKASIDLTPYKSITRIRFRGITGSAEWSDIAIDDIKIWQPPANDAGITSIDKPLSPTLSGLQNVEVSLKNFGYSNLTNVKINWSINSVLQTPFNWAGNILPDSIMDSVVIGSYNFTAGSFAIKVWTSDPNSSTDGFTYNDTIQVPIIVCSGYLKGIYSIGGTSSDYINFTDAINALQYCGIDSAIVFNIAPGIYNEQFSIPSIIGSSHINTITFQSVNGDSNAVKIEYAPINSTSNYVVKLDGADFIKFKNLTISSTGVDYARAIELTNEANNNEFSNNIIQSVITNVPSDDYAVIYSPITNDNNNSIRNNKILNGSYGIYLNGLNSTDSENGNIIKDNIIKDFYEYGINISFQESTEIISNIIESANVSNTTVYGVYSSWVKNSVKILRNKIIIRGATSNYGIYIDFGIGATLSPVLIANNFVSIIPGTADAYGIYLTSTSNCKVYYNNININTGSSPVNGSALYVSGMYVNNIDSKNNILSNFNGGYAFYFNLMTGFETDYNDLYTTGTNLGYKNGNFTDLISWRSASGKDMNSISANPNFFSNTDLHVNSIVLNGAANPVAEVIDDIDGDQRTLLPDIGADEFICTGLDAEISWMTPVSPITSGLKAVDVKINNIRTDTIISIELAYTDGLDTITQSFMDTIVSGYSKTLTFDTLYDFISTVQLKAYIVKVNGIQDDEQLNDTTAIQNLCVSLSGTYTIDSSLATGGTNFNNFNDAILSLKNCGVDSTVIFNVVTGTYNEQVSIPLIAGASAINTITFQSAAGDSTDVILRNMASQSNQNYVLKLDGADYITFKQITIYAMGNNYTRAVEFANNANNNKLLNNIIQGKIATTSESIDHAVIYSDNTHIKNNEIKNNRILNGSYGIYLKGISSTKLGSENIIDGNIINDFYEYGIYVYFQDSILITRNIIDNSPSSAEIYGIYGRYCDNCEITKNKINVHGTEPNYGIYMNYCDGIPSKSILIANNFISQSIGTTTACGIYNENSNYTDIYHNSINITGGSINEGGGIYVSSPSTGYYGNLNLMNNNIINTGGGYAIKISSSAASLGYLRYSDYNNLFTLGDFLVKKGSSNLIDLTAWQQISNHDSNSISYNSFYHSISDLHTYSVDFNGKGTSATSVNDDIDGELRNGSTPDIGADEFTPKTTDIGAITLVFPLSDNCFSSNETITIRIKNFGTNTVNFSATPATLNVSVKGINPLTFSPVNISSGSLVSGAERDIIVTGSYDMSATGLYTFNANTSFASDGNTSNDAMKSESISVFAPITVFPYIEDFESSIVGISNEIDNGWTRGPAMDYKWIVDNDGTPSGGTGPVVDHTRSDTVGNYVYVEADYGAIQDEAYLISPCIDLTSLSNPFLTFWYHMYGSDIDTLHVDINYNGNWINDIHTIGGQQQISENDAWLKASVSLTGYNGMVKFRFRAVRSFGSSGDIAVDDIFIYESITNDVGVINFVTPVVAYSPVGGSITIGVTIGNFGTNTISSVDIGYLVNGSLVVGTYTGNILPYERATYSFYAPFTAISGEFKISAFTRLANDNNKNNDTVTMQFVGVPVIHVPYSDDFEATNYWGVANGYTQWERGIPTANVIDSAYSPVNAWAINLDGNYLNNSDDNLYSPFFDFSNSNDPMLSFRHWIHAEPYQDGARIQYTITNGATWLNLGYMGDTKGTNWYTHIINARPSWNGTGTGWMQSVYNLSQFDNYSAAYVQFRFNFSSNASVNNYNGWAIDDFNITITPIAEDAGVISINEPVAQTLGGDSIQVKVTIKNFGTNTLTSIPVAFYVNTTVPVKVQETWTGSLLTGSTVNYTFKKKYLSPMEPYELCAFTDVTNDTYTFNDSTCTDIDMTPVAIDGGITDILNPVSQTAAGSNVTVTVRIKNFGTNQLISIPVRYRIGTGTPVLQTCPDTLDYLETTDYTFTTSYVSPSNTYQLCAYTGVAGDGYSWNDQKCESIAIVGIDDLQDGTFALGQNIPNPANDGITTILYVIPQAGEVRFDLTNIMGMKVYTLKQTMSAGKHHTEIKTANLPAGLYFYSIEFNDRQLVKKMVIN